MAKTLIWAVALMVSSLSLATGGVGAQPTPSSLPEVSSDASNRDTSAWLIPIVSALVGSGIASSVLGLVLTRQTSSIREQLRIQGEKDLLVYKSRFGLYLDLIRDLHNVHLKTHSLVFNSGEESEWDKARTEFDSMTRALQDLIATKRPLIEQSVSDQSYEMLQMCKKIYQQVEDRRTLIEAERAKGRAVAGIPSATEVRGLVSIAVQLAKINGAVEKSLDLRKSISA